MDGTTFITLGTAVLSTTVAVAATVIAYYAAVKRQPTIDAEFATKGEVRADVIKLETKVSTLESHLHAQIQRLDDKMDARFAAAEDKMGERLGDLDAKRSRQVSTLHDAIRAVDTKVERLLGQLEGRRP